MNRLQTPRRFLTVALALSVLVTTGCAGQKAFDYAAPGDKNLSARTDNTSKRWLSKRHVNIALHNEKPDQLCSWDYAGTLLLNDQKQEIALPVGQRMLIQFNFIEYSRLNAGGRHQSINKLFTAKPASQYELLMAYDDDAIYYEVFERDHVSGTRRSLKLEDAGQCEQT